MAGHSRSKNGVASLAYVTQVGFIRLAHLLLRNSGKPEFRCHPRLCSCRHIKTWMPRNSGLPEFRKLNIAVSRVNPTYGDKRGHDGGIDQAPPVPRPLLEIRAVKSSILERNVLRIGDVFAL